MSYTVLPHRDHWHVDGLPDGDTFQTTTPAIAAVFAFALNAVTEGNCLIEESTDGELRVFYDGPTEGLADTEETPS